MNDWAAIWTKPLMELKAETNISNLGYLTFCPTYQKSVRHSRKCQVVSKPLFPRYIFVNKGQHEFSWYDISKCIGVSGVVMSTNSQPAYLGNEIIEELKNRDTSDYDKSKLPSWAKIGKDVRINDGPFQGYVAKIEELDDRDRVRLLFGLLGRSVPIDTTLDQIGPL